MPRFSATDSASVRADRRAKQGPSMILAKIIGSSLDPIKPPHPCLTTRLRVSPHGSSPPPEKPRKIAACSARCSNGA
eukprot:9007225-Pyramimonas_sp.AAC.1